MSAVLSTADLLAEMRQIREHLAMLCRMQGKMLTRREMLERYGVCNSTLNKRVAAGTYPKPGADGRWLVAEVFEFEARR